MASRGPLGYPVGAFLRLLILTGQRRSQVVGYAGVNQRRLSTIPAERSKNRRAHEVPLPATAQALLAEAPRIVGNDHVFTGRGKAPFSAFTAAKAEIYELAPIAGWTFHDLRRTLASGMARLGQPVHVIEAVLNHRSGTISGVVVIYNRHQYLEEKRAALEEWKEHVLRFSGAGQWLNGRTLSALSEGSRKRP